MYIIYMYMSFAGSCVMVIIQIIKKLFAEKIKKGILPQPAPWKGKIFRNSCHIPPTILKTIEHSSNNCFAFLLLLFYEADGSRRLWPESIVLKQYSSETFVFLPRM